jgi:hypothetical protein
LLARPILAAFAGPGYASGAAILPGYAIAMTLLGAASVLIATHQSRARGTFLGVLLPISILEPVLIVLFHKSLTEVVVVVALSMAALVTGLAILMARQPPSRLLEIQLPVVAMAEAQA